MANTFNIRVLKDGTRSAIIHAYLASDGSSGEITDGVLIDASALSPACSCVAIEYIKWDLDGFSGLLEFDATTDSPVHVLDAAGPGEQDYRDIGGIVDPKASGFTGDVLLTTDGFTAATDNGSIVIKVKKKY